MRVIKPGQALLDGGLLRVCLDEMLPHDLLVHLVVHDANELEFLKDKKNMLV